MPTPTAQPTKLERAAAGLCRRRGGGWVMRFIDHQGLERQVLMPPGWAPPEGAAIGTETRANKHTPADEHPLGARDLPDENARNRRREPAAGSDATPTPAPTPKPTEAGWPTPGTGRRTA